MPKVSVLMPVYNTKEEYLREAIESILNQTFTDFEFIILNDGSTDENVEKVIKSYDDERIKYFHKENTGIADTLNFGMAKAQGEYIARMDSDDISLPERFIKQVEFLDTNKNISILGCNFEIFPEIKIVQHPQNIKYLDLLKGCQIGHPTIMFRRSDFEKYNLAYNPKYKCEDYELWSRAIRYLKFANLEEVLLRYRWHETNLSKPSEVFQASVNKVQQSMLDFLTDDKKLQQEIMNLVCPHLIQSQKLKYTFWQKIFSLRNQKIDGKKQKILMILGVKIKLQKKRQ